MPRTLRIGTRGSQLALWQARWVQSAIQTHWPQIHVELSIIKTTGDKIIDRPLSQVGGKGLFVKEIEEALLAERVDLAVHSMKDMPAEIPAGLAVGAVPARENPQDALVSDHYGALDELPQGARVGTSSLRRAAQLLHQRPDLKIVPLRGNLGTRLKKLTDTDLDAVILAAAGLRRLGLADRITLLLSAEQMLPAVGQGALCIQTRDGDPLVSPVLGPLDDADARTAIAAERAFLTRLEGGCQIPLAGFAQVSGKRVTMTGLVAEPDGRTIIRESAEAPVEAATGMGKALAETLLARGADKILESLQSNVR
ncbi:MAG: hydroxymethylbilane synthase [Desulfatitalea sp.]|nr:hydroxymethylbilane synthase [Desulfatitalea sp.]